ncbi:E3 ubiquitin-protein ligase At3g02290 isoform X6 [Cryptomeria japonica]|uniref:E3 ubiquitin-protein ligase At3g02290 isoform X6 n=1 Tax=Cryptomeria japonica TaxID=3369 RepID=UPI0025ACBAA4|nr:E3 ubiquitin-protein ligase At3g02290 isoform X6 [Cryptomeria japonica]
MEEFVPLLIYEDWQSASAKNFQCASNTEEQDSSSSVQDVRYVRTVCDGLGVRNDRSGPIQGRDLQNISGNTDEGEGEALAAFKNLKCAEFKNQGINDKPSSIETCQASKLSEMVILTDEEDTCPTCLEGYDKDNPRIITKCDHHFHLACILEWMERSDNCPICDQVYVLKLYGYKVQLVSCCKSHGNDIQ